MLKMKLLILAIAITLASCATPTRHVPVALPLPPELSLPRIAPQSLACLSDDTYRDLVVYMQKLKARNNTLRSIIKSTQNVGLLNEH